MAAGLILLLAIGAPPARASDSSASAPVHESARPPTMRLRTAPEDPSHPLDPLTAREMDVLREVLGRQPQLAHKKLIFSWVQLHEPRKEDVQRFKPGDPLRREAFAAFLSPQDRMAYQVVVDLGSKAIVGKIEALGNAQPFITDPDYDAATEAVNASAEVRKALEARGYALTGKEISDALYLDMYAPGMDLEAAPDGRILPGKSLDHDGSTIRAIRVLFADRQRGKNDYGPYIEGLMALVDVYQRKVLKVIDRGGPKIQVKAPGDIFDRSVLGPKIDDSPLAAGPPAGKELKIEGNHVRWGQWDFRYGFNLREGLVLYQISYDDSGRLRPICYRAAVSEMLVPYSSPSEGWLWREFFDSGEYGLGYVSNQAEPGKELPANALTVDAVLPDTTLHPSPDYPRRVFFFERDGGALFAHSQDEGAARIYARAKELVIGFVATVGNYDYLYQWVFRQDASFGFEAELEGLILNKTVLDGSCQVCAREVPAGTVAGAAPIAADGEQEFGTLVSPQMLGVFHQHWINLRLDFDVDGPDNAVKERHTVPLPPDPAKNARGRAFTVETTVLRREREARQDCDPAINRTWVVYNPSKTSSLGHRPGYEIQPLGNTVSCIPDSRWGANTSFSQRHLWVTRYKEDELYAAGRYPNQAPEFNRDNLFAYSDDDESIYNQDVVVWYSLGFTHVTRPEDYPIMPGVRVGVNFAPDGFFAKSPATGHATVEIEPSPDR